MFLRALASSILGNASDGRGVIRKDEDTIRANKIASFCQIL